MDEKRAARGQSGDSDTPTTRPEDTTDKYPYKGGTTETYEYVAEDGSPLFRQVRHPSKSGKTKKFHLERYEGGQWINGLKDTRRVLYHLPEVVAAAANNKVVWIAEGEKDADALRAKGVIATTNPMGADNWLDDYSSTLVGVKYAVIVWDNDEPDEKGKRAGQDHALKVEASLKAVGVPVRLKRAKVGNDASDHLGAGHSVFELVSERPGDPLPDPNASRPAASTANDRPDPSVYQLAVQRLHDHAAVHNLTPPRETATGWEACCPAHDDRNPSLSIGIGNDHPLVVWCHAGCTHDEIAKALDIDPREFSTRRGLSVSSLSNSWKPVDLAPIVAGVEAGEIVGPVPTLLPRADGQCLLYPGEIHSLSGEPETGKGWIALSGCVGVIKSDRDALYYDFEDHPESIIVRLFSLGATPDEINEHFTYVRPVDPFSDAELRAVLDARTYTVAVIDGLTEAYELLGLGMSNDDVAKFLAALPRPIADNGAAVLEIDHVVKNKDQQGRWSIGPQHKLAGISVGYTTRVIKALSRQHGGRVKLEIAKDRHGHVGRRGEIAVVQIVPTDDGRHVSVVVDPPSERDATGKVARPTALMENVSIVIEETPGMTTTQIRQCVRGNNDAKDTALAKLIEEGFVLVTRKGKQRLLHRSIKPFRQ